MAHDTRPIRIVQKHISAEHYFKFKAKLDTDPSDSAFGIALLLRTGMRQDELVKIRAESIDLEGCRVHVSASKDSVNRWVPIDPGLKSRLVALVAALGSHTYGRLISGSESLESQKKSVRRSFHDLMNSAIGPNQYTTHSLRHTFALRCLKQFNNDLLKVQRALGHKSINSTARYLNYLRDEDMQDDILKAVG